MVAILVIRYVAMGHIIANKYAKNIMTVKFINVRLLVTMGFVENALLFSQSRFSAHAKVPSFGLQYFVELRFLSVEENVRKFLCVDMFAVKNVIMINAFVQK